jgi:hypothetical protein
MKWEKKGLIFNSRNNFSWAVNHALQPTPLVLEDIVRVFIGARDADGVSRIGYVDLLKEDPTIIVGFSESPVLDIGADGCFDENGVVPSAVIQHENKIYLFYAGYQLGGKVRFKVFGGLAVSEDGGATFIRCSRTPVFERTSKETLFRVPHTVLFENGCWKAWYGGGDHFIGGQDKSLPAYDIRYIESETPYKFDGDGHIVLETSGNEYRLGRPYVIKNFGTYYMFYGYSSENSPYKLGYAISTDLNNWSRQDNDIGVELSEFGWDSEMMAYPCILQFNDKTYMFYNGNNYGEDGFGLLELIEW